MKGSEANRSEILSPSPRGASTISTHQKVKNHTSWQVKKTAKASALKSLMLSASTQRDCQCFFFLKVLLEGRGCRVGQPVVQSGQSILGGIPRTGRYKDKMAARRMRAELSRRTEVWQRPTEFTSLRDGSGDS